jgi:hypothetical protein
MDILIKKYASSRYFSKIQIDPITYKIQHEDKEENAIVKFNIRYDHWEC